MNIYRVLLLFPKYLKYKFEYIETIMNGQEGPLPISWRYYIAIMTISQSNCEYLVYFIKEIFVASGGDYNWLIKGFTAVPKKI